MDRRIEIFRAQLLSGAEFMNTYGLQLRSLYEDQGFMKIIDDIKSKLDLPEDEAHIERIKYVAKTHLFNEKAAYNYPQLAEIVNNVAANGNAKNSAYISVYLAMRIFELSDEKMAETTGAGQSAKSSVGELESAVNEYDFRLKWPAEYRCEDGHYVRSKNEALVDNWLYSKGICHAYEKAVFSKDGKYCYCSDFYIPSKKIFIEIWGMDDEKYKSRREKKIQFYKRRGFQLLEIRGNDVKNIDDKLNATFCAG